jgi:prolyl-tRNA editing enzyme YbaK/EbsC (Cys-tRNA(Pro) deacylase)
MSTTDLMQALAQEQIGYELLRHPLTKRATEEASALHVSPDEVAKTVVFEAGSHAESMRMRTADLVRMSGAEIVDVCGQ